MSNIGQHRHVSVARRVALPSVIVAGALVVAAVVIGEVTLLRASVIVVLALGILVAALFDWELIRDRRAHGADRVNLARAYAVEYGGWIDDETARAWSLPLPVSDHVNDRVDDEADDQVETDAHTKAESAVDAEAVVADAVEEEPESAGAESERTDTADDTDAVEVEEPAALDGTEEAELWPDADEAPTVVSMAIWEERAREPEAEDTAADERDEDRKPA